MSFAPPVDPSRSFVTSGFGVRASRRTGNPTFHAGVDFRGAVGDPIFAVADGVVDVVTDDTRQRTRTHGYGHSIAIRHNFGQWTVYAHLDETRVQPGQTVHAGQLIGLCGRSSNGKFPGMGPHLHFEVRNPKPDGSSPYPGPYRRFNIDPQPWLEERGIRTVQRGFELAANVVRPSGLSGLGNVSDATLDMDAEGLPAEPIRDPWTFRPLGAFGLIATTTAVIAGVGVGGYLFAQTLR